MTHTVLQNQTLLDIAVQNYGNAECVYELAQANNLPLDAELQVGQILVLPQIGSANRQIAAYYSARNLKPATAISNQ